MLPTNLSTAYQAEGIHQSWLRVRVTLPSGWAYEARPILDHSRYGAFTFKNDGHDKPFQKSEAFWPLSSCGHNPGYTLGFPAVSRRRDYS